MIVIRERREARAWSYASELTCGRLSERSRDTHLDEDERFVLVVLAMGFKPSSRCSSVTILSLPPNPPLLVPGTALLVLGCLGLPPPP